MTTRQFSLTLSLAIYSDQTIIRHFFFLTKLLHTFAFDRHLSASNSYKTRRVNFFFLGRQKASCRYKNAKPKN